MIQVMGCSKHDQEGRKRKMQGGTVAVGAGSGTDPCFKALQPIRRNLSVSCISFELEFLAAFQVAAR